MEQTQPTGVPCPECGGFITIDIKDLLSKVTFACQRSDCGTVLHLDRARSRDSLKAMADIERSKRTGR